MIVHKGLVHRRRLCNARSVCLVIFTLSFMSIQTTNAIKCFICGSGSDAPFFEAGSTHNETFIRQKTQRSCDDFDRIPLEDKYKYEMECPEGFNGCMLNVGASVMRTCSELKVDDCKTVNKVHYCYCNRPLCNGENAESIIEKLGDINDNEEEEENEFIDSEEASGSDERDDDDDFNMTPTSPNIDSRTTVSLWPVPSTPLSPPISTAVTFNSCRNLLMLLTLCHLIVRR